MRNKVRGPLSARWQRAALLPLISAFVMADPAGAQGRLPSWTVTPIPNVVLGSGELGDEDIFSRIGGAGVLSGGRYMVADQRELRISIFNPQARSLTTFGRRGMGPGEFQSMYAAWVGAGDTIHVWDPVTVRLTQFLADGRVVDTDQPTYPEGRQPAPTGARLDALMGAFPDGRVVLSWLAPGGAPAENTLTADHMYFGLFDSELRFVRMIGEGRGLQRTATPGMTGSFVFSPYPWGAAVGNAFLYTDGSEGAVIERGAGRIATPARRVPLQVPGPRSLRDAWRRFDAAAQGTDVSSPRLRMAMGTNRSMGSVPAVGRMFADDVGNIWAKIYDPATDAAPLRGGKFGRGGEWIISSLDGTPRARVTVPASVAPITVVGDRLLAVSRDETDVETFVVYRINRQR